MAKNMSMGTKPTALLTTCFRDAGQTKIYFNTSLLAGLFAPKRLKRKSCTNWELTQKNSYIHRKKGPKVVNEDEHDHHEDNENSSAWAIRSRSAFGKRIRTKVHGPCIFPRDNLSTGLDAESTRSYHPRMPSPAASS